MICTNNVKIHALFLIFNTVGIAFMFILNISIYLIICITQSKCVREREQSHCGSDFAIVDSTTFKYSTSTLCIVFCIMIVVSSCMVYSLFWLLCRPKSADGSFTFEASHDDDQLKGLALAPSKRIRWLLWCPHQDCTADSSQHGCDVRRFCSWHDGCIWWWE